MSDSKPATTQSTSRRRLLRGVTTFALPLPTGAIDPGRIVAERWCSLEVEQQRLILKWQGVENWLFEHRNWPQLSEAEREATPEGARLKAIDDQLDGIRRSYDALLPLLKSTRATTREGVFARFDALLHFLIEDEHPNARIILKSCIGDLRRLWL
jgi:hypothetical protein